MSASLKKLWNDYGIGAILVLLIVAYGVSLFAKYLSSKGMSGYESNNTMQKQYKNTNSQMSAGVVPSEPLGQNEVFASANGAQTSMPGIPSSCSTPNIQNLLKAGYHIGIDTIGQTLRNANLQIRSEPPNPQLYVGPWNTSTISPDYLRPPLEIGSGSQ